MTDFDHEGSTMNSALNSTMNSTQQFASQGRNSFWARTFDQARSDGGWVRVDRLYTRTTAAQISSDIACSHRRDINSHRMRGMRPGERWDSFWGAADNGPSGDHVVWIRLATDE